MPLPTHRACCTASPSSSQMGGLCGTRISRDHRDAVILNLDSLTIINAGTFCSLSLHRPTSADSLHRFSSPLSVE